MPLFECISIRRDDRIDVIMQGRKITGEPFEPAEQQRELIPIF